MSLSCLALLFSCLSALLLTVVNGTKYGPLRSVHWSDAHGVRIL